MTLQICIACIIFLLLLVMFLSYKLYTFSIIILNIESAIERSLDILQERYSKMTEIVEKPVFFDSVEIRQVISDIKASREAVLLIANILTSDAELTNENEKEDEKSTYDN